MSYTDEQYEQLQLALSDARDANVLSAHCVVSVLGEITAHRNGVAAEEAAVARALRTRASAS